MSGSRLTVAGSFLQPSSFAYSSENEVSEVLSCGCVALSLRFFAPGSEGYMVLKSKINMFAIDSRAMR